MTDNIKLVTDALEYYDANTEKYKDQFKNVRYIKFIKAKTDMDYNMIVMYDENKEILLKSRYEVIGLFYSESNTWAWAWSVHFFSKNNTNIVRKLFNYGATLDPQSQFLKTELITSRFRIANPIQLDIHIAIASYLSKKPLTYQYYLYRTKLSTIDSDGYVDTKIKSDDFTIYYIFLLDFEHLNNSSETKDETSSSIKSDSE